MKFKTVKQLIKFLSKLPQDMQIITYSTYNRGHVLGIMGENYTFDGNDVDCYHSDYKTPSDIPAGNYFFIGTDDGDE